MSQGDSLLNRYQTDAASGAERTILEESWVSLVDAAVQRPLKSAGQIADRYLGTNLAAHTNWVGTPEAAAFGTGKWHAQQIAAGIGSSLPFLASALMLKPLSRFAIGEKLMAKGILKGSTGLKTAAYAEAAGAGVLNGVLFQEASSQETFWQDKFNHSATGAVSMLTMVGAARQLNHLVRDKSQLAHVLTSGTAGVASGLAGAETSSLLAGGGLLDGRQLAESAYSMAFTGIAMESAGRGVLRTRTSRLPELEDHVAKHPDASTDSLYLGWLQSRRPLQRVKDFFGVGEKTERARIEYLTRTNSPNASVDKIQDRVFHASHTDLRSWGTLERTALIDTLERDAASTMTDRGQMRAFTASLKAATRGWSPESLKALHEQKRLLSENPQAGYFQSLRDIDAQIAQLQTDRRGRLERALNADAGTPPVRVLSLGDRGRNASYVSGVGIMGFGDSLLMDGPMTRDAVEVTAHERRHTQQDVLKIRREADQLGIGKTATPEQMQALINLADRDRKPWDPPLPAEYVPMRNEFYENVLRTRNGARLSGREAAQADRVIAAYDDYSGDPFKNKEVTDLIEKHNLVERQRTNSSPDDAYLILASLNHQHGKMIHGFGTLPQSLARVVELAARVKPTDPAWNALEAHQVLVQAMRDKQVELKWQLRDTFRHAIDRYLSNPLERQAYPTGLLNAISAHRDGLRNE